ncbi:hypothetical protein HYC85_020117 [Camellia sinensis]|uniref:non-specific serine/threonine protein kinase n=1 Tax=Camellia sinensis TaxID=4442 RepID=A0A7J7GQJ7_CAMSI|nr:hypothetical protein HYC85_020117 [Camellia sinensis]
MEVNEKCDVYSFGVLALEVIMGKHPGDLISSLSSSSSSSSTSTAQGIFLKDVLDQRLLPPRNQVAEQILVNKIFHGNLAPLLLDIYDFSPEFQKPREPSLFFEKCKDSTESSLGISTRGQSSKVVVWCGVWLAFFRILPPILDLGDKLYFALLHFIPISTLVSRLHLSRMCIARQNLFCFALLIPQMDSPSCH